MMQQPWQFLLKILSSCEMSLRSSRKQQLSKAEVTSETLGCTTMGTVIGLINQYWGAARNVQPACLMGRGLLKEGGWGQLNCELGQQWGRNRIIWCCSETVCSDMEATSDGTLAYWTTKNWPLTVLESDLCFCHQVPSPSLPCHTFHAKSHSKSDVGREIFTKIIYILTSLYLQNFSLLHLSLVKMAHHQEREGTLACIVLPWSWEILDPVLLNRLHFLMF